MLVMAVKMVPLSMTPATSAPSEDNAAAFHAPVGPMFRHEAPESEEKLIRPKTPCPSVTATNLVPSEDMAADVE
jgi:hypothetical protein